MGIEVYWDDDEHRIMRHVYTDPWTAKDVYSALTYMHELLDAINHQVQLIIDVRQSQSVPPGILRAVRQVLYKHHPNQGTAYIVGANTIMLSTYRVLRYLYPPITKSYRFANTLDEAYALILEELQQQTKDKKR
ncbi:MAG: hypothetical protein D6712_14685 [Chloroflexi bacterium]|nr:MAG: hypothetical protein D6712_14685 [Chloroflexota bacterium]